jgi:hypothetical protein
VGIVFTGKVFINAIVAFKTSKNFIFIHFRRFSGLPKR